MMLFLKISNPNNSLILLLGQNKSRHMLTKKAHIDSRYKNDHSFRSNGLLTVMCIRAVTLSKIAE